MIISISARHFCLALVLLLGAGQTFAQNKTTPIEALARRIVPAYAKRIQFRQINAAGNFDVFEVETINGKLNIGGNNPNAMATGLNYYLKNYSHTLVTWDLNEKITYPASMPVVKQKIRKVARIKSRFFLNYCTFGYTMPWWKWADWQHLIDWMALNGINMPLSITGQEAIWYRVWKKYGLQDEQIRSYFTGPAYLPWHRMANIDHWDGPLPMSWIDNQLLLEKKIVERERELGMTPVLPAFAGHVPADLKLKYPEAKINTLGSWGGFNDRYHSNFLDPFDPLFKKIQNDFLKEQTKAFGTDHIYGIDPFNEVTPPSWEPSYLAKVSKELFASVTQVDPKATWLQMSWLFYIDREKWTDERIKAYLTAVEKGKLTLLDYYCDNTEVWKMTDAYFGQPYLWCYLGNFGANTMLAGNLNEVEARMENAFKNGGSNLQGIGSTLEGFDVNPIMYTYVFEKAWSEGPTSVSDWVEQWAKLRGGTDQKSILEAWKLLAKKIYNSPAKLGQGTLTNAKPFITGGPHWTTTPGITYSNKDLLEVWGLLIRGKADQNPLWKYDVTNVGRQVLGNYFGDLHREFQLAYQQKNLKKVTKTGKQMLSLLSDLDKLLGTQQEFLLGKWINNARKMGKTRAEKDYYEENACKIITVWGGEQRSLNDYANKSWAGLTEGFYRCRWQVFIDAATSAIKNGGTVDMDALNKSINAFEDSWVKKRHSYPSGPVGDTHQINNLFYEKYKNNISNVK